MHMPVLHLKREETAHLSRACSDRNALAALHVHTSRAAPLTPRPKDDLEDGRVSQPWERSVEARGEARATRRYGVQMYPRTLVERVSRREWVKAARVERVQQQHALAAGELQVEIVVVVEVCSRD